MVISRRNPCPSVSELETVLHVLSAYVVVWVHNQGQMGIYWEI